MPGTFLSPEIRKTLNDFVGGVPGGATLYSALKDIDKMQPKYKFELAGVLGSKEELDELRKSPADGDSGNDDVVLKNFAAALRSCCDEDYRKKLGALTPSQEKALKNLWESLDPEWLGPENTRGKLPEWASSGVVLTDVERSKSWRRSMKGDSAFQFAMGVQKELEALKLEFQKIQEENNRMKLIRDALGLEKFKTEMELKAELERLKRADAERAHLQTELDQAKRDLATEKAAHLVTQGLLGTARTDLGNEQAALLAEQNAHGLTQAQLLAQQAAVDANAAQVAFDALKTGGQVLDAANHIADDRLVALGNGNGAGPLDVAITNAHGGLPNAAARGYFDNLVIAERARVAQEVAAQQAAAAAAQLAQQAAVDANAAQVAFDALKAGGQVLDAANHIADDRLVALGNGNGAGPLDVAITNAHGGLPNAAARGHFDNLVIAERARVAQEAAALALAAAPVVVPPPAAVAPAPAPLIFGGIPGSVLRELNVSKTASAPTILNAHNPAAVIEEIRRIGNGNGGN